MPKSIAPEPDYLQTRVTLLGRLKDISDDRSWREFFDLYWKLIYRSALLAGLSHTDAEDVVQETILTVFKKIGDFNYDPNRGSFKAWLLTIVRWRIGDHRRRNRFPLEFRSSEQSDGQPSSYAEIVDNGFSWEEHWEQEWQRNLLETALERTKRQVPAKQFQIFDLYVVKEWPVCKIKEALGVSATQVYLAKHRVSKVLRRHLRAVEREADAVGVL